MINWIDRLLGETQTRLLTLLRRSQETVSSLAVKLGLTDNAVRSHVAALGRDGIVESGAILRDTGGKPARLYGLTKEGEELFPKAYALVLAGLIEEIARREGRDRAIALLGAVGDRMAGGLPPREAADRIDAAAAALRGLGADVEVQRAESGSRLQGYGCPLSAVTANHAEACAAVKAVVERLVGRPVVEACTRGARPRCAFEVPAGGVGGNDTTSG